MATAVHWGYGTGWGLARDALGIIGITVPFASVVHFAAVWGAALVILPRMKLTPAPQEWGAEVLAIDGWHHLVYAGAAGPSSTTCLSPPTGTDDVSQTLESAYDRRSKLGGTTASR